MRRIACAVLLSGCHSLLGIEDTTVGDEPDPVERVGLDRVIIAEVIGPQLAAGGDPSPAGLFVDISFVAEPITGERLVFDERDDRGLGCVVYTRAAGQPPLTSDEGTLEIEGARIDLPGCEIVDGRYLCSALRTSTPDAVVISDDPLGLSSATFSGATPPFSADDVGRFLVLPGERPLPITAVDGGNRVILFDPFATDREVAGAEHRIAVGLGPNLIATDVIADGDDLSITKTNGASIAALDLAIEARGSGYRLDDGSNRPEALPLEGAANFSCAGVNGDCADEASHTAVWARATDVRGDALALSSTLAPIASVERELHCMFESGSITVSAGAMDALLGGGARRVAAAVMRGALIASDDDERPVVVFAGFGHYGFTTISEPSDSCDPAFQDCSPGLRCTAVSQASGDAVNRCVFDGTAARGMACEARGSAEGSTDDCVAGTSCSFGICRDVCDLEDVGCGNDQTCLGVANQQLAVCEASCDVLDQSTCSDGEGCYFTSDPGIGVCVTPRGPGGPPRLLGESCQGFLNECEIGTQCVDVGATGTSTCHKFCDTRTCTDGQGIPDQCGCSGCAANETCVPITGAQNVGFCAPPDAIGCDCSTTPICPPT